MCRAGKHALEENEAIDKGVSSGGVVLKAPLKGVTLEQRSGEEKERVL